MEKDKNILAMKSFYAGIFIGIGAIVYMLNPGIVGAILFTIGLFGCVNNKLTLFTGKVGYQMLSSYAIIQYFIIMLIFNALGIMLFSLMIGTTMTNSIPALLTTATNIVNNRLSTDLIGIFTGAIGCGMLMSHAVDRPNRTSDDFHNIINYIPMLYCVPVFILSGFPHCIADIGYYTIYTCYMGFNPLIVGIWCISILGNTIGCHIMGIAAKYLRLYGTTNSN